MRSLECRQQRWQKGRMEHFVPLARHIVPRENECRLGFEGLQVRGQWEGRGGVRTGASPPNPKSNRHLTGGGLSTSKMRAESLLVLNHLKIRLMNLPVCIRLIWTLCLEPCDNWNISVAKRYLFKEGSCCTQRGLALFCTPGIRQAKVAFSTATSRQLCLRIYNSFTRRGTSEGNIKFIFPLTRRQNGVINIPGKPVARLTKRF